MTHRRPSGRRRPRPPARVARDGPHIRLGLAWAALTMVATIAGPVVLSLVLSPVAAVAAAQAARSWRRSQRRVPWRVAAGGAGAVAFSSAFGLAGVVATVSAVAVLLASLLVVGPSAAPSSRHRFAPLFGGLIAVVFGLAGAAPVLLRGEGLIPAFVLLGFVHVYDASAYVVGSGANAPWEGPVAGVASIAAVTLAVAAVLSPPFRGASPWLLGFLAAALTPLGPIAAAELVGDGRARVPALRRLDGLLVVAPIWALVAALVLD